MAADCSFFLSSTAFTTVCAPYCSADGSGLLILPLVNGFHNSSRTVLLSGSLSGSLNFPLVNGFHDSSRPVLLCGSLGGSLNLPLVDGLHDGLPAVLLSGWQRIAHTSARQRLSRRIARRIAHRMAAHCSFFRSSTAFPTVYAP